MSYMKKIMASCKPGSPLKFTNKNTFHGYNDRKDPPVRSGDKSSPAKKKGPCWTNYEMVGMKKKGGRTVPNCVPKKK